MSDLDLNLLRVFDALFEEQSVTRAGARLGLTQSAVSHGLNRLRHHFGDPLFIRGSHGMAPTARALEIGPGIHAALTQLRAAIQPPKFHPAATPHRFTLATGAYGCAVLVPGVAAALVERAPLAELLVREPMADPVEQLDGRRSDFVLRMEQTLPDRVCVTPLFRETLVWAVRTGHPLPSRPSLEALAAIPHVVIALKGAGAEARNNVGDATWEGMRPFQEALAERGLERKVGVTVPDIYSAVAVAARSDMATLVPRRLGQMSEKFGALRLIEPPHPTPDLRIGLLALRERLSEPALAWMHDLLVEVAAQA